MLAFLAESPLQTMIYGSTRVNLVFPTLELFAITKDEITKMKALRPPTPLPITQA